MNDKTLFRGIFLEIPEKGKTTIIFNDKTLKGKINPVLNSVPRHYDERGVKFYKVTGQLQAPTALPPVSIGQAAGWTAEPVWMLWSKEESLAPSRNRTPDVKPVTRRYTD
jgi:hypothetical protein